MSTESRAQTRLVSYTFICFALIYLCSLPFKPYMLSFLVKAFPIACLCLFIWVSRPVKKGRLVATGLLFSAVGDILLDLPQDTFFIPGMGSFIMAHLFYTAAFFGRPVFSLSRMSVLAAVIIFVTGYGIFLFPHLGDMAPAIYIYLFVISIMVASACTGRDNNMLIISGACLFMISDSMIALTMFVIPVPFADIWIMSTYYAAQALLSSGAYYSLSTQP